MTYAYLSNKAFWNFMLLGDGGEGDTKFVMLGVQYSELLRGKLGWGQMRW